MEPAGNKSSWQEKVKDTLGDLGIAGETVSPSPARTIEELASLGIIKGYSTIVAVGSEKIVNKIVTALISQKSNNDTVLGIIPDDYDSRMAKRIGVKDYKEACQALKSRKLQTMDTVCIEPNKYFMTDAIIESPKSADTYLLMGQIQVGAKFNKITIKPGVKIEIEDENKQIQSNVKNFFKFLIGKKEEGLKNNIYSSLFHSKEIQIETPDNSFSVKVDGDTVAKTPILVTHQPKALKIIVARETIINEK
jgi:diacylglycerol kinase family enzyme